MMLGHALAAFALVAGLAGRRLEPRRALAVGAVAGLFAAVPDVDMLFALSGLVEGTLRLAAAPGGRGPGDVFTVTGSFWAASTEVHRSVTHSLVVAAPVSVAAGLLGGRDATGTAPRAAAAGLLALPVVAALAVTGPVAAAMTATLGVAVWGVALLVRRRVDLSGRAVAGLAAVGLGTHPLGDLFTGEPPRLLYPLGVDPLSTRVALSTDPTLHLLGVFGLELLTAWAAVAVGLGLLGRSPLSHVRPVAVGGLGYAVPAVVLVPPTLSTSYHFVFSVLGVGLLAAAVAGRRGRTDTVGRWATGPEPAQSRGDGAAQTDGGDPGRHAGANSAASRASAAGGRVSRAVGDPGRTVTALVTGTAAVTLAWAAYLVVYVVGV